MAGHGWQGVLAELNPCRLSFQSSSCLRESRDCWLQFKLEGGQEGSQEKREVCQEMAVA